MADWLDKVTLEPANQPANDWLDKVTLEPIKPVNSNSLLDLVRQAISGFGQAARASVSTPPVGVSQFAEKIADPAIAAAMAKLAERSRQPKPAPKPKRLVSNLLSAEHVIDPLSQALSFGARGLGTGLGALLNARSELYSKTPELFKSALEGLPAATQAVRSAIPQPQGAAGAAFAPLTAPVSAGLPLFQAAAPMVLPENLGQAAEMAALTHFLGPKIEAGGAPERLPGGQPLNPAKVLSPSEFRAKMADKTAAEIEARLTRSIPGPVQPMVVVRQGVPKISNEQFRLSLEAKSLEDQVIPLRNLESRLSSIIKNVAASERTPGAREPLARRLEQRLASIRSSISSLQSRAAALRQQAGVAERAAAAAPPVAATPNMPPTWFATLAEALPRFDTPLDISDPELQQAGALLRTASEAWPKQNQGLQLSQDEARALAAFGGRNPDIGEPTRRATDIIRIASQLDAALQNGSNGPFMRLARALIDSEIRSTEMGNRVAEAWNNAFPSVSIGSENSRLIARYAQQGLPGIAPLSAQERLLVEQTPELKAAAAGARQYYDWMLDRLNSMNRALGQPEIRRHELYVTHINDMRAMFDIFGGHDLTSQTWAGRKSVDFQYAKERIGEVEFFDVANSVIDYNRKAMRLLFINPVAKKIFSYAAEDAKAMPKNAALAFQSAAKYAVGNPVISTQEQFIKTLAVEMPPALRETAARKILTDSGRLPVGKLLRWLNSQNTLNTAVGNISFAIAQLQSIPFVFGKAGNPKYVAAALGKMYGTNAPAVRALVAEESIALRSHMVDRTALYGLTDSQQAVHAKLSFLTERMNQEMSTLGYLTGAEKARAMGMVDKAAINAYADEFASAVNGIMTRGNTPEIIRGVWINMLAPFSRMSVNAMNFTRFDLVGKTAMETAQNVFSLTASAVIMNGILNGAFAAMGVRRDKNVFEVSDVFPPLKVAQYGFNPLPARTSMHLVRAAGALMKGDLERTMAGLAKFSIMTLNPYGGGQQLINIVEGRPLGGKKPAQKQTIQMR